MKQKIICIYAQNLLLFQSEFPLIKFKTDTALFNFCKIYAHEITSYARLPYFLYLRKEYQTRRT